MFIKEMKNRSFTKNIITAGLILGSWTFAVCELSGIEAKQIIERQSTIVVSDVQMSPEMSLSKRETSRSGEYDNLTDRSLYSRESRISDRSESRNSRSRESSRYASSNSEKGSSFNAVESIKKSLRAVLESDIVKTRKFDVLNGRHNDDSVDYVMVPTIIAFHDRFVSAYVENSNVPAKRKSFLLAFEIKITDVKSGQILESFNSQVTEGDLDPNFLNMDPNQDMSDLYLKDICQKASKQIIQKLLDAVFPARVADIDGKFILINRGHDSAVKIGDEFDVYAKGRAIRDPDTGAILGHREVQIAKVAVVEVLAQNLSECKILSLKNADTPVIKGHYIRKIESDDVTDEIQTVSRPSPDSLSKDELSKYNAIKSLRIRAAKSGIELKKAKDTIAAGESKIKHGRNLASQRDFTSGAGTTMERRVDNSVVREKGEQLITEGEALVTEGKLMQEDVSKLYQKLYDASDTVIVKSTTGKEIVCVPLVYENSIFTVLVQNRVFQIKESDLDDQSRARIQKYK